MSGHLEVDGALNVHQGHDISVNARYRAMQRHWVIRPLAKVKNCLY